MKILASDFDKTLFVENEEVFNKNILAIKKFITQGNIFCIITGRNYSHIKEDLNKHKIPYSYLICADGAKIFNNVDYCIQTNLLDSNKILQIKEILEQNNCEYYLDDGYNQTTNIHDCIKVVGIIKEESQANKILTEIKQKLSVYIYLSTEHINITDIDVNKCNSLKELLNLEKLSENDLYVIGDEVNDIEMLQTFKGAIMKEHNPILDKLNKREYNTLYEYIEELSKN